MTPVTSNNRSASHPQTKLWSRRLGLVWLCLWLSVAGGFGYRYLTHETSGEVQAGVPGSATTKPIEQIQVGERVAFAINPTETLDTSLSFDVNPRTWRKVTLRTDAHEVVLLRPASWVRQHLEDGESTMMLTVPEVGIDQPAEVVSIWPCPSISAGEGRIVIGTFTHVAPETICVYVEGLDDPIRCTPNHIIWSVGHRDFVEAHELQAGNLVLCDDGARKVVRVQWIDESTRVYNLEVQGQHVYQVSSLGLLVHNTSPLPRGGDGAALETTLTAEKRMLERMKAIVERNLARRDLNPQQTGQMVNNMTEIERRLSAVHDGLRRLMTTPPSLN